MITDEEIKVINKCENIAEEYKINFQQEITSSNLVELKAKQTDDYLISNIKIKEDFIIIISTKLSKKLLENKTFNEKNINIIGFDIRIIKLNLQMPENNEQKNEININIPLKEPKLVANNNLLNKYFFYDFIKIDDTKSYLHIYIFGQMHIYKIYQKDNQLKYNKIELKKFNDKTKVLYLGEYFKSDENILEIALLLKPINTFMFLEIDVNEKCPKIVEKKYDCKCQNAKNILYKFIRSYCGIFLFSEKESDKKYIIYKNKNNENNKEIQIKEVKINTLDNYNNYFYSISNKLYLISQLPSEKEEENNYNYCVLGIFILFYDEENDIYNSQLIQKIMIKNEGCLKNYSININVLNYISIQIDEMLLFIHLDENSSVDMINKYNLNSKKLQITRIISDKSNEWCLLLSYINSKLYLSKFIDDKEKCSRGKCIINYETFSNDNDKEDEKDEEKEEDSETEEKESEKENVKEEIITNNDINNEKEKSLYEKEKDNTIYPINQKIEEYINKIVKERVNTNNEKIEAMKKESENKLEMIQKDVYLQEKENEKLEKNVNDILIRIGELHKMNEDEEKENINNKYNKKKSIGFKNDVMNFWQYNNLRQWNQMKMLNQYNLMNNENMFINSQMSLNPPRTMQLLNQNRNPLNQGNYYFNKNIYKSIELPLNNFNLP